MRKKYLALSLVVLLICPLLMSGCTRGTCCPEIWIPRLCLFKSGKKPPVYYTRERFILDYDPCGCGPEPLWCDVCCCEMEECSTCGYAFCDCSACRCEEPEYCWQSSCTDRQCLTDCCSSSGFVGYTEGFTRDPYAPLVDEYRIANGDVLEISVVQDEDTLAEEVIVAPDGRIYYLFLDPIYVEGKTVPELRLELEKQLTKWYLDPQVTIIPQVIGDNTFTVLGRVNVPGLYPLNQSISLRQAIGMAGGIVTDQQVGQYGGVYTRYTYIPAYRSRSTSASNLRDSFIVRGGQKLPVDFQSLLYSADGTQDIMIEPGDYIYIASNANRDVFILGNVSAPTALPYDDGMTLMHALTSVGGWPIGTPYGADMKNVLIIRGSLQCPCPIRVDLKMILDGKARDVCLKPGDIVYVHNKKFRFLRELVHLAITGFVTSFVNEAGIYYAEDKLFNLDSVNR